MFTKGMEDYLEQARIPLRLACLIEEASPFVLSIWFLYRDGKLYLATPKKAKVVRYLTMHPLCAFEIASDKPPYCGIRGQARATIIESAGIEILELLLKRYLGSTDSPFARKLLGRNIEEVAIELEPVKIYSWDFTERMKGSIKPEQRDFPCPK